MDKLKNSFFQTYFDMPVPRLVVRTNVPEYTIIEANTAYYLATGFSRDQVINQSLLDLFSYNSTGVLEKALLQTALTDSLETNTQINIPEFQIASVVNGSNTLSWWQIDIMSVADPDEKPAYLIITTRDVTHLITAQKQLEDARHREQILHEELATTNEELSAANEELTTMIENLRQMQQHMAELNNELENRVNLRTSELLRAQADLQQQHELLAAIVNEVPAGICILKGPEMIMETVNSTLLQSWNRDETIIGMPLIEILPEIRDQEFPELLNEVYCTGNPFATFDAPVKLIIDGEKHTVYRDYSYTPLKGIDGKTHSIVALSIDVTERALGRLREQQLLEEQSAINEELSASNEELTATNEELSEARDHQQKLIDTLAESESRFRKLIMEAPVAICVLKGPEYLLDAVNAEGLRILGKDIDIIGRPLREILNGKYDRPFIDRLNHSFRLGETYYGNEVAATFDQTGVPATDHFNFVFKPIKNEYGSVEGMIIVASKVTDMVKFRREKESAETKLGLAIEAANMGAWHIEPVTKELKYNSGLVKLFGYEGSAPMTYDQAIAQVTDDYREILVKEIEKAIADGGTYDITYTQRKFNDDGLIWLRSMGKVSQDQYGNYSLFSGVVIDITEQKHDEQRKNDFIGMVSHELKTPLTSLMGYAQLLQAKAVKNQDSFGVTALAKVTEQIKKMTTMINGFLNISRLESGKIQLTKERFNLEDLVREQIEDAQTISATHQLLFSPFKPVPVFADRDKIGSVLSNLISNAIKYSPLSTQVEIHCKIKGSSACLSVQDHGMGIPAQDLPKLFERFYRVESEQTNFISGFGIGLYLSAEIIQHHNGQIWAESVQGKGSTFYFSLPVQSAQ